MSTSASDWTPISDSKEVVAARYEGAEERIYVRFYYQVEWWYGECTREMWLKFKGAGIGRDKYIEDVLKQGPNGRAGILWGSP